MLCEEGNISMGDSEKVGDKDEKKNFHYQILEMLWLQRESSKIWHSLDLGNAGETRMSANLRLLEREVTGLNGRRSISFVLAASCCHLLGNIHFGEASQDVKLDVWKKANKKTGSYVVSLGIA